MSVITLILVERDNIANSILVHTPLPAPPQGGLQLRIDSFGLTTNNVTYAALGNAYKAFPVDNLSSKLTPSHSPRYFDFFPVDASVPDAARYGTIPVWGLATGFFPLASHIVLVPGAELTDAFFDVDRPQLPAGHMIYNKVSGGVPNLHDPFHSPTHEPHMLLLRPLFFTSYLLADKLIDEKLYTAKTVVITSASSKTSLCLAFVLKRAGIPTIGLTSASSIAWLADTNAYTELLPYDALGSAPPPGDVVLVDVAGNQAVVADVGRWAGEGLKKELSVGMTHWESRAKVGAGSAEVFFAPAQLNKKQAEMGVLALGAVMGKAFAETLGSADEWVEVERVEGEEGVLRVWRELVAGKAAPRKGLVLTL
ncbi:hypothetical protein BDK51DRAFT_48316 [Blyttiomyces helicus]|uniref:DUF2855 family protein n=1 Tax=Blyttiomyces helicus TaxID=388810 RepID=A0A4P9WBZ4_9FUNG|nr:hypothetical protein BDK51DRAFT_48316 [Blyttiomyces helicus]|eukprot:RKO89155.1 hypothetical protein BDK51DRAFT_48316 [Blyttiomyces helicus]